MKKSLLATVAAVAFIAGGGLAAAENAKDHSGAKSAQPEMNRGADTKGGAEMKGAESKGSPSMKRETTGSGAAMDENKSEKTPSKAAPSKADNKAPSTTGQSSPSTKSSEDKASPSTRSQQAPAKADTNKADTKSPSSAQSPNNAAPSTAQGQQSPSRTGTAANAPAGGSGSVSLSTEQKSQIRTSVLQSSSAPKVSRSSINFNISVGTVVPRSVHFVTVPDTIVRIHPAWRGYSYFIVDEEIIIVEPRTYKIVAVLVV